MKKLIAMLLALAMVFSFAACGKTNTDATDAPTTDASSATEAPDDATNGTTATPEISPAHQLLNAFYDNVGSAESMEALGAAILKDGGLPEELACDSVPVETGWLPGFQEDVTGFEEGASFGPIISTIPFVGYVFRLADDADVGAFVDTLKSTANLNWNICTEADEMVCEASGNVVFFVMAPASFED